jgi:hypothetical protein
MNTESSTPVATPAATPSATSAQAPAAPIISGAAPQPKPATTNPSFVNPRKAKKNKQQQPAPVAKL